tara:strand:+ start:343 stop:741 length:399 start_codon:yes stop_codon:yes gene_type:complete
LQRVKGVFVFMAEKFEMNVDVKVDMSKFAKAVEKYPDKIKEVVQIAARNIEKDSKQRMTDQDAVDTGATRLSIFVSPGTPSFSQHIGPTTEYAPFIEFGTRYMAARAFMIPTLEKEAPRFKEALSDDQMFPF